MLNGGSVSAAEALDKARAGQRLTAEDGLTLFDADLLELGRVADRCRRRVRDDAVVTFVIDRYINYTNVCITDCGFCAFYRRPGHTEAYLKPDELILQKIGELVRLGGTTVLLQGGHHPQLGLEYYTTLFRQIKAAYDVTVHSLTASEVDHIGRVAKRPVREVLLALKEAGLDSLPGGGAEILVDRVRQLISPKKISAGRWLEIMELAHGIGLRSTATMMFGSVETPAERIEHLLKIRDLQDRTRGFRAFIHWSFVPGNSAMAHLPMPSGEAYLRMLAVARIMLDNVPHVHTGWVTEGPQIAQMGLAFGADDIGGILMEEEVISAAGLRYAQSVEAVCDLIRGAGKTPAQRNSRYEILRTFPA